MNSEKAPDAHDPSDSESESSKEADQKAGRNADSPESKDDETETEGSSGNNLSRSSDAILNQLISTVSQASYGGNSAQPSSASVNTVSVGQDTAQAFIQQLATLSAANAAPAGVGLPVLPSGGLGLPSASNDADYANNAMQAAAYLLSTTANNLLQANAQQQQGPQQHIQSILGNQGASISGNNLLANLLAANASAAPQAFHQPAYTLISGGNATGNPVVLGQLPGLAPAAMGAPSLVQGIPAGGLAVAAAAAPSPNQEGSSSMTNRRPVTLDMDYDSHVLNDYQSLLRKQIELFETGPEDVRGKAQGRNKPVVLGQVGIRCRHCSQIPKSARPKGSVYYSRSLVGIYQIAQNMAKVHYGEGKCRMIPETTKNRLLELQTVNRKASGGKDYWVHCLEILGVYEDGEILRFKRLDQMPAPPR